MLPALIITLREGLEAALTVGIIAAFLKQRGRSDALRWVWMGVAAAIALCAGVAVLLHVVGQDLPDGGQDALETVVGTIAVGMVAGMVVWMRRHVRTLKGQLEASAASALAQGSVAALVGMAFLAVIREGFEASVFLLAMFQSSSSPTATGVGAGIGLVIAIGIGYGIYAGGVAINLRTVFRATGCVLALVAGGLAATVMHNAHEAGWITGLNTPLLDLRSVVHPGSALAAMLSGLFGVQPQPTTGEVLAYIVVAAGLLAVVLMPTRTGVFARRRASRVAA